MISSQLELHCLNTNRPRARLITALTLLKRYLFRYAHYGKVESHMRVDRYGGHVSAALVLGGVDHEGPHLYTIAPHGSTDKLPYVTMGSGSMAAMAVFEARWRPDLEVRLFSFFNPFLRKKFFAFQFEEAKELVADAIRAGIFNDLGSGSNVDLTAIHMDGKVTIMRNYDRPNPKPTINLDYTFPPGATAVLTETRQPVVMRNFRELVQVIDGDAMQA